jgi:cell shape-determining protein MreD
MNRLSVIAIFATAYLAVFAESCLPQPRGLLGANIDVLPALMVYAGLAGNLFIVSFLCLWSGLWFDTLSANPLGVSILPLFLVGLTAYRCREFVLRDQAFAQFIFGLAASAAAPVITVLLLLNVGEQPLIGWQSLWQWFVMAVGGAAFTPLCFKLFNWLDRTFGYQEMPESSFRPDREIKRGRN